MPNEHVKLHVLDVGHGDSLVFEFPGGRRFGIVDCHRHPKSHRGFGGDYDFNEPKVLTFLKSRRLTGKVTVEFLCCTHPHADHYDGLAKLIEDSTACDIPIRRIWEFGHCIPKARAMLRAAQTENQKLHAKELTQYARQVNELVKRIGSQRYAVIDRPIDRLLDVAGVRIDALAPDAEYFRHYSACMSLRSAKERRRYVQSYGCSYVGDDNTLSSALLIRFGNARLLLGGDVTNVSWKPLLANFHRSCQGCTIFKVSHHGSVEGFFPGGGKQPILRFLRRGRKVPTAIISGGYLAALPHPDTLALLVASTTGVYCTGAGTSSLRPYFPDNAREDVRQQLILEQVMEVGDESSDPLHGNITLTCSRSGRCSVTTETGQPSLTEVD